MADRSAKLNQKDLELIENIVSALYRNRIAKTEREWKERYVRKMVERGVQERIATMNVSSIGFHELGAYDIKDSPEQVAEDEMASWGDEIEVDVSVP